MEIIPYETELLLAKLDEYEKQIRELDRLNKEYDEMKKTLKESMLEVGKKNNLEQVKWTTPNGIQITCSIGHKAEFEKQTKKEFDMFKLQNEFPEVYEQCLKEVERDVCVKNPSNDRLVITLPKGK